MKIPQIYHSKEMNNYVCDEKTIFCVDCKQKIEDEIFLFINEWTYKRASNQILCRKCFKDVKRQGFLSEFKVVIMVEILPEDAIFVVNKPPEMSDCSKNKNNNPWSADYTGGGVTVDNTVYAGKYTIKGAKIGKKNKKEVIDGRKSK